MIDRLAGPTAPPPPDARRWRLGTRASPLALAQAAQVALALAEAGAPPIEIVPVTTSGDLITDRPLAEVGGKALWTRELDRALMAGEIDLGVHSLKDIETELAPGVALTAFLPRADARDRLVGWPSLDAMPPGARLGTSSPRRAAQARLARPDLVVLPLRGNVATRLARLERGEVDATLLAAAGLERLGLSAGVALPLDAWLPAAGQGVIAVATRATDAGHRLYAAIDHGPTRLAATAERAVLARLGGSCRSAIGAHARPAADGPHRLLLEAQLLAPEGASAVRHAATAVVTDMAAARALGAEVAGHLLARASPAMRESLG